MIKEFINRDDCAGVQWRFRSVETGLELSIICHQYSYGGKEGLFETMCSWEDDVSGRLTFGEVQKRIEMLYNLDNSIKRNIKDNERRTN